MRWTLLWWMGAAAAGPLAAQTEARNQGVQVRINGDILVPRDARDGLVVVVRGNARVEGAVRAVLVVDGNATLADAQVGTLTVIRGHAELLGATTVHDNLHLLGADVRADAGAKVLGTIERSERWELIRGFWMLAAVFSLGLTVAILLSGLVAAAVAPEFLHRAGEALTGEPGKTWLAALFAWIVAPLVAVALVATIIGIPTAIGVLVFVLPALGFLGYLVAGTRLGEWILTRVRGERRPRHPYLAAFIGLGTLLIAARVPILGGLVTPLAGVLGGGAIGLVCWRRARTAPARAVPAPAPELYSV